MTVRIRRFEPGASALPFQLLANSEESDGKFLFGEGRLEPGPGPGLHVHEHEHESFYVIEGVLTIELDGERLELRSGDYIMCPPGVPHRFSNLSDQPVRVVGAMSPTGIEKMFEAEAAYFATLDGPPDLQRIAEITKPYGVTILGPPLTA
jgi:quercetin dioxygenase-like cupin family protein